MSAVRAAQHEAEALLLAGWPFESVEAWIERQPLPEDARAAVWLAAYLERERGRPRRAEPHAAMAPLAR